MPPRRLTDQFLLPPRAPGVAATQWVFDAVRAAIIDGRLRPGSKLVSTRRLARQLGVSRGTVTAAFDTLQSQGYVEGRPRSGIYVPGALPVGARLKGTADKRPSPGRVPTRPLSGAASRATAFDRFAPPSGRAFRTHQPALDLFPSVLWARIVGRRARRATARELTGCGAFGYEPLREAVADYLGRSRGVRCAPAQVAIVSGVQEAVGLVTRLLVDPGDVVCMEDPGYPGAVHVFESAGAKVVPVSVDDEGMRLPPSRAAGARLAYVTPAHQFPLGTSMSLARRLRLLEWARASRSVIVEDDYDSEYRYSGRPLPALQGLDRDGVVVFVGSFSKVLFPSIRLGYLVVPPDLVDPLAALLTVEGRQSPLLDQAALCDFIEGGHYFRHLRRMRQVYGHRLAILQRHADARLMGLLALSPIEAGLQTSARLLVPSTGEAVAASAARHDVEVTPLSRYARQPMAWEGLLLGFGAVDEGEITRGVDRLARLLAHAAPRPAPRRGRRSATAEG